ncbi:rod shape-determining protein MreC [Neisseria chenwenguii]|uniref:Cell shape-determining protein MreC n=1 Tax=Neisseria chenwenguii TaxID=1853278 RepID=A0A220S490_9NEIS|nr:rod shape-determining protein MreC [Neisseria chenwenguii]ASK28250.1 rod shape-determining protein MreC [Neisseria chenwenguii]ROV57375.1 rod shape-determining protein MreC [Neisseria chenwenguii]
MEHSSLRFNGETGGRLLMKLAAYSAVAVVLLMLDSRFSAVQTIRQTVATVLYPMQWLANQPVRLYQYANNLSQSQTELLEQNRVLQEENGRLKIRLQRDKVNLSELNELKKLYGLQQRGINNVVGAEVISSGKDPLSEKLIINKGSSGGVKEGDTVIDTDGLIGRVTQVQLQSSEVTLLSGGNGIVPVTVERTGERNLVYGRGGRLDLRYFPVSSDLKAKDVLLTSGLDDLYPAGIPVATVEEAVRGSGTPYYAAKLKPFAALNGSRFVLVVSRHPLTESRP